VEHYDNNQIKSKGEYNKNKKVGIWEEYFYEKYILLERVYDYNNNILISEIATIHITNIIYPKEAMENGIAGTVIVKVKFDSNCNFNVWLVSGIGYGCDEEAIRVVNEAMTYSGKYFCDDLEFEVPINFILN